MCLGSDLVVSDLQTKITEFLAPVLFPGAGRGKDKLSFSFLLSGHPRLAPCRTAGSQSITLSLFVKGGTGRAMAGAIREGK